MKNSLAFTLCMFCFSVYAGVDIIRPSSEKICLTGMKTNSEFDGFVRAVHTNQGMMNLPKSRLGLLSSVFVKLDKNHDGLLAEAEITTKCDPCPPHVQ